MLRNPERHLRAKGNLSYIDFVLLVKRIWENAHSVNGTPTVPVLPSGNGDPAVYPCILYSLDLRRAHPEEPKMKIREIIDDNGESYVVSGQRFQNVVRFTSITESDPDLATEIIEAFEDFMMEYTPVLKELGASELVYSRRYSDSEENRSGSGVVKRSVAYLLTTEKLRRNKYEKLDEISIQARTWLEEAHLYPYFGQRVSSSDNSPRYYLQGPNATLGFSVDELGSGPYITIKIPKSNFRAGDRLYLMSYDGSDTLPSGMVNGIYRVVAPVNDDRFTLDKSYTVRLESLDESLDHDIQSVGNGLVFYIPQSIPAEIFDQQFTLKEEDPEE